MGPGQRFVLGVAFAGVFVLSSSTARANGSGADALDGADPAGIPAVVWLATSDGIFGSVDLIFAIAGSPIPPQLAAVQIVIAGLTVPLLTLVSSDSTWLSAAAIASGAWFTTHGIYCAAIYSDYQVQRRREQRVSATRWQPLLSEGNFGLGVRGAF